MILVTTASQIDGYRISAIKGIVQAATFEEMLHHAQQLGGNAIIKADCHNTDSAKAYFHGAAVLVEKLADPMGIRA